MKTCVFFGAILLALSVPSSLPAAVQPNQPNQVDQSVTQKVVSVMNLASNVIYNAAAAENQSNNVVLASLNLLFPLAELYFSTLNDYKKNVNASYQCPFDVELSKQVVDKLIQNLYDAQNDKVKFFHNLYYQQGLTLEPNFVKLAKDVFKSSEPQSVDLSAQQFVQEYNQITNDKTEGFINNLLKDDYVKNAGLVQQDIGYLDLEFENKFNLSSEPGVFKNEDNSEESVQFLTLHDSLKYGSVSNSKASWVELPLKNKAFSLYFVAFEDEDSFESFEKNIGLFNPLSYPSNVSPLCVKVPVFYVSNILNWTKIINEAKIGEIFNDDGGVFVSSTLSTDTILQEVSAKLSDQSFKVAFESLIISGTEARESNSVQIDRAQFLKSPIQSSADGTQAEIVFDKPFIITLFEEGVQVFYASIKNGLNNSKLNKNTGSSN